MTETDPLDIFRSKPKRRASPAEEARFRAAFDAELEANPDRAPGPAGLARRLGLRNTRNLNGRLTHLRRRLLREAGFGFNETFNRWIR